MGSVNICSLRAMTLNDAPYLFTVADMPVVVGEDMFVLLRRKFSPILRLSTLALGSDVGVFVGDIIEDVDGSIWYVCYESGFIAYDRERSKRKFLYEFEHLKVVGEMTAEDKQVLNFKKIKIKFKYQEFIFTLFDIVGKYKDDMLTQNIKGRVVTSEVQQDLLVSLDGRRVYLGDLYRGLPVFMCWGRICIQTEFGVYDILEKSYLTEKYERRAT